MPEKSIDVNGLSIGISSVIVLVASYAVFVIKSLQKGISDLKESLNEKIKSVKDDIEKDIEHHRTDILDIYNNVKIYSERIAKVEADISTIKSEHGKNHK
jgi:peptidoglycan hydrolase CwlO-like protein